MHKSLFRRWFNLNDPAPAQETTEALARRGVADAQFHLGLRYANAAGDARDYAQAEHWYLKAAGQNHPLAHFNLGIMYDNGQGAPRDQAKARVWIQKAAELGDAAAQYRLGESYHRAIRNALPENVSESRIAAYKWFRLSATQGYKGAELACEIVNLHMTREDVLEAGCRVAAFNSRQTDAAN